MTKAPSAVARTLAAQLWHEVQHQEKVGPGTYWFSTAGHGGLVSVVDSANFDYKDVRVAREMGRTELVSYGFGQYFTSVKYNRESLMEQAKRLNFPVWECWVGEEDTDWALLVVADPSLADGLVEHWRGKTAADVLEMAEDSAQRWNPTFLEKLQHPGVTVQV